MTFIFIPSVILIAFLIVGNLFLFGSFLTFSLEGFLTYLSNPLHFLTIPIFIWMYLYIIIADLTLLSVIKDGLQSFKLNANKENGK